MSRRGEPNNRKFTPPRGAPQHLPSRGPQTNLQQSPGPPQAARPSLDSLDEFPALGGPSRPPSRDSGKGKAKDSPDELSTTAPRTASNPDSVQEQNLELNHQPGSEKRQGGVSKFSLNEFLALGGPRRPPSPDNLGKGIKAKPRKELGTTPRAAFNPEVQAQNFYFIRQPTSNQRQGGLSNSLDEFPALGGPLGVPTRPPSRDKGKGKAKGTPDELSTTAPRTAFNPDSVQDHNLELNRQPGSNQRQGGQPSSLGKFPTRAGSFPRIPIQGSSSSLAFDNSPQDLEGKAGVTTNHFNDDTIGPFTRFPRNSGTIPVGDEGKDLEWRDFLLNRCYNCYRLDRINDPTVWLDEIEKDLDIYRTSHRGKYSLLPAKPRDRTTLPKIGCKIVANHFKVHFSNKEIFMYSIYWQSDHYLMKDDKLNLWLKIKGTFNEIEPVYSGGSWLTSPKKLKDVDEPFTIQYNGDNGAICNVTIKYLKTIQLSHDKFLGVGENGIRLQEDTHQAHIRFPEETIQVGNQIISHLNKMDANRIEVGRYCFDKRTRKNVTDNANDPNEFLCTMTGYFRSVRALEGGLNLNVDVMSTGFYKPDQTLKDTWYQMLQSNRIPGDVKRPFWSDAQRTFRRVWDVNWERANIVNGYWKNLKIVSTHRQNMPEHSGPTFFSIWQLTSESADRQRVEDRSDGKTKNFIQFMHSKYHLNNDDLDKKLPAIKVSKKKDYYLPWGCCKTTDGSRFPGKLEESLLKKLERDVTRRYYDISRSVTFYPAPIVPRPQNAGSENEFYFKIEHEMMAVDALALSRPEVWVGGNPQQLVDKFSRSQKFMHPASVRHWGVLSFHHDPTFHALEDYFITQLVRQARDRGMNWAEQTIRISRNWEEQRDNEPNTDERRAVQKYVRSFMEEFTRAKPTFQPPEEHLDLILCFIGGAMTTEYAALKYLCDIQHGVPSQVVLLTKNHLPHWRDPSGQPRIKPAFLLNVLLKINVKCGGQNFQLNPTMIRLREESTKPPREEITMLLGADVTHPTRSVAALSIAAVVATTDRTAVNYACRLKAQEHGEEIVELREMVRELLDIFRDNNDGHYPDNILFFRDGVGESQYFTTLRQEGRAILDVAKTLRNYNAEYKPKLAIILAIKRHHTRFFKVEAGPRLNDPPEISNLDAGTAVVSGVTHPREYDFFLCSQAPAKGTSRPTHYHVLLDQIGIEPDSLYKLVYNLCYTFQRCPTSVALVTPVYYAHLAAFRGKLYMEYYNTPGHGDLHVSQYQAHDRLKNRLWFL